MTRLLVELDTTARQLEVGLTADERWIVELQETDVPTRKPFEPVLQPGAVLLVTGGASGITAAITKALATQYRPHMVIVGRSPLPQPESLATRDIEDTQHLRQYLIQDAQAKRGQVAPADIEQQVQHLLKARHLRTNLAALEATGASVEYHAVDVRDATAFGALIDTVYAQRGRIDGVIHGAGVIDDKLICDKTLESFTTVFHTKVTPALVLADKLRPETLRFVMLFSSVAARFGNVGQTDYSAANELLNKLAHHLNRVWSNVHVAAINWGPWDGGMVSEELLALYATRGIDVIPTHMGVRFFLEELQRGKTRTPEVVIAAGVQQLAQWKLGGAEA